ncbi:MAG: hypothetical protein DCC68_26840 [Planctomycetota bacterium]|nr:MAG: hypothetical protein DCC68_26840 [Planctomycetota bacterium]
MIPLARLDAAIRAAAGYLTRNCDERGQFVYRVNLDDSIVVEPRYNLVRHAGCVYALVRYCRSFDDPAARETVRRAIGFLRDSIAPIDGRGIAVHSRPDIEGGKRVVQCKLGATGLALAALALACELDPALAIRDELAGLAEFLLYLQKPSGEFYSKFDPIAGRRLDEWTSLYYPGEAALGLVLAGRSTSNPGWTRAAQQALEFLATRRQHCFPVEADHWAMLATCEFFAGSQSRTSEHWMLMRHIVQICESMLHEQRSCGGDRPGRGWFTPDRRTTPTATRLEGLLATVRCLPRPPVDLQRRIETAIDAGMSFLLDAQVEDGPYVGAMPRDPHGVHQQGPNAVRRSTEVRIDYVQHALSAFVQYRYGIRAVHE